MRFPFPTRLFGPPPGVGEALGAADLSDRRGNHDAAEPASPILKTIGWISAGLGALALGLVVGREIRQRYKFTRRTPYDFYAHAGDEREMEFGVGI
jgi:hypothetical protein